MYEDPLLYVRHLKPQSFYVEQESTSVFELDMRPPLVMRQLQYMQGQKRYVTLVLVKGERVYGKLMRLEAEHAWIMTDAGPICVAINTIRSVR
ncbi:MAG: hypothetical protein ABS882_03235 [Lysinibacillus sp.]